MLTIHNLEKKYGDKIALYDFSMNINEGEIIGLVGKNGAGKSTLLNCIAGNIKKTSGKILYNDKEITEDSSILNTFGFLITANFSSYLKTYDNLKLLCYASGEKNIKKINEKIDEVLSIVSLEQEKYSYVHTFSFGMKQRLGLAQALLNCDNLLILDEPLVGLDLFGREIVKDVIKSKAKKGVSILFSDHNLNEVEKISDRIVCIDKGKKFFDGKFVPLPKYHIKIKNTNNVNIDKNLFSQFNDEILFKDDDEVIIKNKEHINFILNFFYKNQIFVEDILVEEDSIKKFFNDGEEVYDK